MEEINSNYSIFSKIFTPCLLVLSSTFGESWQNSVNHYNGLNLMRTSRLLIGETSILKARGGEFAYLKDRINDLLIEDDDDFGKRLNDLEHDDLFRNRFNKLIYDESNQKNLDAFNNMNGNLDLSFDNLINIDDQNNELKKKKKKSKRNNSLDLDNFYDEDSFEYENDNFPNSFMELEPYQKSKKSKKTFQYGKKNKKSTSLGKNNFDIVLEPESLKEMVMKASAREERPSGGFMDTLKRLDKEFEVELLRAIKKKSFSDYEECKFKTYEGKQKHFMRNFRIYLPPTVLMAILMIMMTFKVIFNGPIFAFLSISFFAMAMYYAYKFSEINRMNELYKSFSKKINFKKQVK